MTARSQIGPAKHFGSIIQRAQVAKGFARQPLEAHNKMRDVACRIGKVMIVPINDHCSPLRENDLEIAEVAMAGADADGAWGRRSSLQPSKHLLTFGSQRRASLRYKAALALCASNEFLDPRDPACGRGCRMKSRQPSRAPLSGLSTMMPVTAFENLLC